MHATVALLFGRERSVQAYAMSDISPYFWANGHPPKEDSYQALVQEGFADWRLEVNGLVRRPLCLSLEDLLAMLRRTQVTKHNCIQGWSDVGEWGGVQLYHIIELDRPLPEARYVVFHATDNVEYVAVLGYSSSVVFRRLQAKNQGEPISATGGGLSRTDANGRSESCLEATPPAASPLRLAPPARPRNRVNAACP